MKAKRVTIHDIAKEMGISASYVSRALNNQFGVNKKIIASVKKKADELNYRQNFQAANLRRGSSKTIGVIVPHIDQSFFSNTIAGIEEACVENNHSLVICQSHESFKQECIAIETLIHQNVDCILISISAETQSSSYLEEITNHNIHLIQFDRYLNAVDSYKVVNDNQEASYTAVNHLIKEGYRRIAFIGGPDHLTIFKNRKEGYLEAIKEAGLSVPYNFIIDNSLSKEMAIKAANQLLSLKEPPDAFFTVSDYQSLGVLQVAESLGIKVPGQLGILGYANEVFTELLKPSLSSINQKSKELGKCAANLFFENILKGKEETLRNKKKIIKSEIIIRQSSILNHL
jgi:LacI family transcriptional regulator